jgi:hypothetical protein
VAHLPPIAASPHILLALVAIPLDCLENQCTVLLQTAQGKLTILARWFGHPHTRQMKPLARTSVVVASNHLAETDVVAVAVPRLALSVHVLAYVQSLFVGEKRERLYGGPFQKSFDICFFLPYLI